MTVRRLLAIAIPTLLLLLALDTAGWWWLTGRLLAEAAAWQADRVAEGTVITAGPPERGGWPLRATATMRDVTVASDAAGTASWHADGVRLVFAPVAPGTLSVVLLGEQTVRLQGEPPVSLSAGHLDIRVPLDAGQVAGVVVEAQDLLLPAGRLALGVRSLSARLDGTAVAVDAAGLTLPAVFGGVVDRLVVQGRSTVPLPPLRDPGMAAAAWRRAGGQVAVEHAALRWGALDATASGTLALDAALQPAGSATLHVSGYGEALAALVRAKTVSRGEAQVTTAVLGLMARPGTAGPPEAELPLTLADGVVRLGAMPLARLPALLWP